MIVVACATACAFACVLVNGWRTHRRLCGELRRCLIAQAAHEEYAADLLLWEDEYAAYRVSRLTTQGGSDAQP